MSHVFYYNMKIFLYLQCFTHLYLILIWVWIMWKTRFCEHKNYWLTFLFDTHILKTAKDDGDYPMSKKWKPRRCVRSLGFSIPLCRWLMPQAIRCLFVFSVQPFANIVANYIYHDRDKNDGDYFIQWFHLLPAGGSAASTPYHNSLTFSIPTLLKLNSSIRSYTLLYRILAFRHIKYWKILYRCSGTFRQK